MKKQILAALVFAMSFTSLAFGDEIDKRFKTARKYLSDNKTEITSNVEEVFTKDYILVVGEGSPKKGSVKGQRRLTAITAAKVVAQRRIAELVEGVAIVSETTVKDSELVSDDIKSAVAGLVKGAAVVVQDWNENSETALVIMKVGTKGSRSVSSALYNKVVELPAVKKESEAPVYTPPAPTTSNAAETSSTAPVKEENSAVYDGLIIDATEQNFQPALINRIFATTGEILYDPAKISQKVLIEQGCGEYTNNTEKAKAALNKRGVSHPLLIKASGIKTKSDLKVSDEDAAKIHAANQSSGFIPKAQIAFVMK